MNTDFETCRTGFDIVDKIFLFVFALQKYSQFAGNCTVSTYALHHQSPQVLRQTQCLQNNQTTTENSNWIHERCNVLNIYYIHAILTFSIPHHKKKVYESNVLYVVTQGHYVILPITSILGSILFFQNLKSLMSYVILRVLFPDFYAPLADN